MTRSVALLGATGFIGSHVTQALIQRGVHVMPVPAPRGNLTSTERDRHLRNFTAQLVGCEVIVNAAGVADPAGSALELTRANHHMPDLLGEVAAHLSARLVHISSAAVQGRRISLDSSQEYGDFSPYSSSKAEGERALLRRGGSLCIYRPPGVHGRHRTVTRSLVRLASSPAASVAAPGTRNTPQALVQNVADAIAFLATTDGQPPLIVHHPSEGLTTASLLTALGGRPPRQVPRAVAGVGVRALFAGSRLRSGLEGHARRLEVLWLGQQQAPSWLTQVGWRPPHAQSSWGILGRQVRKDLQRDEHSTENRGR